MGGIDGHAGVIHKFCRFAGAHARIRKTLVRGGPVSPNNALEKNKGCEHLASASELNFEQFGARGGASRGRFFAYTPVWPQKKGMYSPLTIALKNL